MLGGEWVKVRKKRTRGFLLILKGKGHDCQTTRGENVVEKAHGKKKEIEVSKKGGDARADDRGTRGGRGR